MVSVHDYATDCHNQDAAADNHQCVGEELRTREGLQVVPCSAEGGEDVDKQQRKEEQEYQIGSDIVLGDVVFRYFLV